MQRIRQLASFALIAVIAVAAGGCAARERHIATVTVISAKGALDLTQDLEPFAVCGGAQAPAAPNCLTQEQHRAIHGHLADAYAIHKQLAIAVRDWPQGQPAPATIPTYLQQITAILQEVVNALPPGSVKDRLTAFLGGKS